MHRNSHGDNSHGTNLAQILCLLVECMRANAEYTRMVSEDSL